MSCKETWVSIVCSVLPVLPSSLGVLSHNTFQLLLCHKKAIALPQESMWKNVMQLFAI